MLPPTTDIDTEDEDTADTDDNDDNDEDDESVNIYEEALNCEELTYRNHSRRQTLAELRHQAPPFNQVKPQKPTRYLIIFFP